VAEHIMIDIGAHFGHSAEHFVSKGWKIYCFEPDPVNREKLVAKFGDASSVKIDPRAVGEKVETGRPLFSSSESSGISSLHAFHDTHKQAALVDVTTVTEIVKQHELDQIGFLKIDAEGFDLAALRGVPWNRIRPAAIECEFEDAKTVPLGHNWRDMAEFLTGKGYTVYVSEWHPVIRYGIQHDWRGLRQYPCELTCKDAWGNLLAFLEDPGPETIAAALKNCVSVKRALTVPKVSSVAQPQESSDSKSANGKAMREARAPRKAASFWGAIQSVVSFSKTSKPRNWVGRQYARFAGAVKERSLVLFRAGQAVAWSFGAACRRPGLALTGVVFLLVLIAAPFYAPLWPHRGVFWAAAGVIGAMSMGVIAIAVANEALRRLLEGVGADMDTRVRLARQAAERRNAALETRVAELVAKEVGGMRAKVDDTSKQLAALAGQLEWETGSLGERIDRAQATSDKARAVAEGEFDAIKAKVDDTSKRLAALGGQLERETGSLGERIDKAQATSDKARAAAEGEFGAIKAKVDDTSKRLAALAGQLEQNAAFQRFNRVLTYEHVETLLTVWSKRLGVRTTKPSLAYLAHRIRVTEQNAVGRLATAIEDAVLRTLVSSAVRTKKLEILEIGTLFGIGLAMLYENNHGRYDAVHVTAIDPLDGYYNEKEPDVLLNIPVTKATFWRNMDMAGIPRENITLIESLSTSDEAIAQAKARKYDVLVIDGDHSYAGVKADFVSYVDLVQRGGFIIFDDYGTQDWPDVKRFVDDEVAADKRVTLVGSDWRTAVFRVVETTNRSRGGPHRNKRLSPDARSRKMAKKRYKKH
jgi:FkbM family methyltransferase